MKIKNETSLQIVKNDIFTRIRKNIFAFFFKKEALLLDMMEEIERPRNHITGKIVIPKEIKKF